MTDGNKSVRISLRQADGEHYPLFYRGDPDTRNLALVPATAGQAEADIHFFHHSVDGSPALELGTLRFSDLPENSGDTELQLDAAIGAAGIMTITVRHPESGRIERLEMELPDEPDGLKTILRRGPAWRNRPAARVLGVLFIAIALAGIFFLTSLVAEWGREEAVSAPLSRLVLDISRQRI